MKKRNLIIPIGLKPEPDKFEKRVAELCANYFKSDIAFVKTSIGTTPDIKIVKNSQYWEIKNIKGNGKRTIDDNLRKASKQADNVIISLLKPTKMRTKDAESKIRRYLGLGTVNLKRVLLVGKNEEIIEIKI